MSRTVPVLILGLLLAATPAAAQSHPTRLATLFEDIYGPNGLVLSSEDVALDGTSHAAHFNSAFQSEFRLVNIALTSQLAAIPLPSAAPFGSKTVSSTWSAYYPKPSRGSLAVSHPTSSCRSPPIRTCSRSAR